MIKHIPLALFISCISVSASAYVIDTNFNVDNKTAVPMFIVINQPNGQIQLTKPLPPHQITKMDLSNGDHTGYLYQTSTAPFTIREKDANGKIVAQGRLAYYVGGSMWNKYSFLNEISAADNIQIEPNYSCHNGGYNYTFNNSIVINGTPGSGMAVKKFPSEVSCQGFKYSETR